MNRKYYAKFRTGLIFASVVYFLTILVLGGFEYYLGGSGKRIFYELIGSFKLGIFFVPTITLVLIRWYPVSVKSDGLGAYNAYGWYNNIAWEDIDKINRKNALWLKYVRVYDRIGHAPIWIPISLNDCDGFLESVQACGGDKDMFSMYFGERG